MNLTDEIRDLKGRRHATILAHNYVNGEVQDVADFVGDSLELSLKAKEVRAPVIVFCGVSFMAETAKILSPDSIVLHPDRNAGCPMADMADAQDVSAYRAAHPGTLLVAYVNTTAAVKAEVDLCCTSANAARIIRGIPADRKIMFLPDRNLGANIARELGREMELWPGFCPTHNRILPENVLKAKTEHPDALLLVHPECTPAVVNLADHALSTGGMLRFVRESKYKQFLIGTECGIVHRMKKENPDKDFILIDPVPRCPNMKKITLENILWALQDMEPSVELDPALIEKARVPIEKMLAIR